MGSLTSNIDDDIDEYKYLCKKYGEKEKEPYSNHHYWLIKLSQGETKLTYVEYSYQEEKIKAIDNISKNELVIKNLKKENKKLKKKFNL
jgi:hypothetical protein